MHSKTSAEHLAYLRQLKRRQLIIRLSQGLLLIGIFALWELAARLGWINAFVFSQPTRLECSCKACTSRRLWKHLGWTVGETVIGLLLARCWDCYRNHLMVVGFVSRVLDPYIVWRAFLRCVRPYFRGVARHQYDCCNCYGGRCFCDCDCDDDAHWF